MPRKAQFPMTAMEYEFTYGEPEITAEELLEARLIANEQGAAFKCRECKKMMDIEHALGCHCYVCDECAMQYVTAD